MLHKAYFQTLELDIVESHALFKMLDPCCRKPFLILTLLRFFKFIYTKETLACRVHISDLRPELGLRHGSNNQEAVFFVESMWVRRCEWAPNIPERFASDVRRRFPKSNASSGKT